MKVVHSNKKDRMCWNFSFNHSLVDQKAVNLLVSELMEHICTAHDATHTSTHTDSESKEDPDLAHSREREGSGEREESREREGSRTSRRSSAVRPVRAFPMSLEAALTPGTSPWRMFKWAACSIYSKTRPPLEIGIGSGSGSVPLKLLQNYKENPVKYAHYCVAEERRAFALHWALSREDTEALVAACQSKNVTVTSALSAANMCVTSLFLQAGSRAGLTAQTLKCFLSVDTRKYGKKRRTTDSRHTTLTDAAPQVQVQGSSDSEAEVDAEAGEIQGPRGSAQVDWTEGQIALASHFVQFVAYVPLSTVMHARDLRSYAISSDPDEEFVKSPNPEFWDLATQCRAVSQGIVEANLDVSVLFLEYLVEERGVCAAIDAPAAVSNPLRMGRDCPCSVSNVGIADFDTDPEPDSGSISGSRSGSGSPLGKGKGRDRDRVRVKEAYFGSGCGRSGAFCSLTSMTVRGCLNVSLHFATPLVTVEEAVLFSSCLKAVLRDVMEEET